MAVDIDSLLELELKHTEEAELHGKQAPPEREPLSNDPAVPEGAGSLLSGRLTAPNAGPVGATKGHPALRGLQLGGRGGGAVLGSGVC